MTESYILITGATSDIGEEICKTLSKSNRLVLSGRNPEKLQATLDGIENSEFHLKFLVDLSNPENVYNELNAFILKENISISAFVHAAGDVVVMTQRRLKLKKVQDSLNVNLISGAAIIKALLKKNNKKSLSKVVFISSIAAIRGYKGYGLYSASKSGLLSMAKSLSKELAPRVNINSLILGALLTKKTDSIYNSEYIQKNYPLGEGELSDASSAIEFLISNKSDWMTGQELIVDGGITIL